MNIQQIVETVAEELSKYSNLDSIEIEVRLGIYDQDNKKFNSNIGEENYEIIEKMLSTFNNWISIKEYDVTDIYSNNLRLTINNITKKKSCIEKIRLKNFTFISETHPLDFRISISREIEIPNNKFPKSVSKLKKRDKKRISRKYDNASFDLSRIQVEENDEIIQTFEYEVEHIGKVDDPRETIFKLIYKILDANFMIDGFMKTDKNLLPLDLFSAQMV